LEAVQTFPRMPPDDPAKWPSLALSATVHLLLLAALFLGVQWKSKPPAAVEVEVWRAAPAPTVVAQPDPRPEPRPEPRVEPKPEPTPKAVAKPEPKPEPRPPPRPEPVPKAVAKPEPRPEPKPPVKPDIPLKEERKPLKEPVREPKAKEPPSKDEARVKEPPKKDEPKTREPPRREEVKPKEPPRKEEPKSKEEPRPREPERRPSFDEELKREQKQLQQQKAAQEQRARADAEARQLRQLQAEQAAAEAKRGQAEYIEKIRGKIRGNITLPPSIQGNPQAEFEVTQLPNGEVLEVKLRRSSGNPALDAAVERAIHKSSPLPKPAKPELFERVLKIPYRPRDD